MENSNFEFFYFSGGLPTLYILSLMIWAKLWRSKSPQAERMIRKPVLSLSEGLVGKIFGDKGYISQPLFDELLKKGLKLITRIKKNMKNKLMPMFDKLLLRKRPLIETVNDQLKNISQIEHTRHRSINNFFVNLLAGIAAYAIKPKKPSLNLRTYQNQLTVL